MWLPSGYLGVDSFFVLSGYVVARFLVFPSKPNKRIVLRVRRLRRLQPALVTIAAGLVSIELAHRSAEQFEYQYWTGITSRPEQFKSIESKALIASEQVLLKVPLLTHGA